MSYARNQEEVIRMMTNRTYKEHSAKWQPGTGMHGVCLWVGLGSSPASTFIAGLGQRQPQSIDNRYIRQ